MSLLEKIKTDIVESHVWKSIFRHGYDDTPRNRVMMVTSNVFLHLHPAKVRRHAVRMRFTWCMGGLTFLMFLMTAITGVYLMFYYRPVAEYAYADMKYLEFDMPFGMLMRNMHRWAAHAWIVVWLHMFRVFLTGSYKPPREFNWIVGVILLVLTLLLSFTGYLLPWDQLAIWAVTVGSNMARATPLLGYEGPFRRACRRQSDLRRARVSVRRRRDRSAHAAALLHSALHLHPAGREHLDGGALLAHSPRRLLRSIFIGAAKTRQAMAEAAQERKLPVDDKIHTWPHLVRMEFLVALFVTIGLTLWSMIVDAPLEEPANPTQTPNPSKAPWYFLGLQEMLVYFDPWHAGVVLPTLIIVGLMVIPYIDINPKGTATTASKIASRRSSPSIGLPRSVDRDDHHRHLFFAGRVGTCSGHGSTGTRIRSSR